MKETGFIKQNKEKWIEFEKILQDKKKDPDRLSGLFIQITDDLSYSRTFYPNRSVRVYLNNIAQQVFHSIYRNKRERWKRFAYFWKEDLPRLIYDCGPELRLSFIVFIICMLIGAFSCYHDPEFMRVILGDRYVEMTKANIESGDPMAVYKSMNQVDMFLGIALNNIMVAFNTFLLGILCGIGSMGIMVFNGIMVGVFQYFFIQRGLFVESFLAIWLHGTLEISSIVIAGAAGLTLGKGLVFPGTLSRIESFQVTARRGFKLLLSIVPILAFAALIESFLTRYTMGTFIDIVRIIIILFSMVFILGFFVWYPITKVEKNPRKATLLSLFLFGAVVGFIMYPWLREKYSGVLAAAVAVPWLLVNLSGLIYVLVKMKMPVQTRRTYADLKLPPTVNQQIETDVIKNNGEIFSDTFVFLKKFARRIVMWAAGLALIYTIAFAIFYAKDFTYSFIFENENFFVGIFNAFFFLGDIAKYFSYSDYPLLMAGNIVLFSIMSAVGAHLWSISARKQGLTFGRNIINFLKSLVVLGITSLITWVHPFFFFVLLLGVYPVLMLWLFVAQAENLDVFTALGRAFRLMGSKFFNLVALYIIFVVVSIIFLFLVSSPIVWVMVNFLNMGVDLDADAYWMMLKVVLTFSSFFALAILFLMTLSGAALFSYSSHEMLEANSLKKRIMALREKKHRAAFTHG
jgi:uncharacterized membrane protein SpoIIM required for sporulation